MNFVLVHGGFHGGWCWRELAQRLRERGHHVTHPTQTGLGERRHLGTDDLSLDTYIEDVVQHLVYDDLSEVVLVGHSFGGISITGAADRVPGRIARLVYLDSLILQPGQTPLDALPPAARSQRQARLPVGRMHAFAPPPVTVFGIPKDHPQADWVAAHLTPQPASLYDSPLHLAGPIGNGRPCAYVACTQPVLSSVAASQAWARQQPGWSWHELATGHDAMITAPQGLADLLLEIARA